MLWLHDVQGGNSVQLGITPTTNWQQVSLPYTVDSTGKLRIHLYQFAGSETTYWDEVALTPVPPVNPGFETGSLGAWNHLLG